MYHKVRQDLWVSMWKFFLNRTNLQIIIYLIKDYLHNTFGLAWNVEINVAKKNFDVLMLNFLFSQ